MSDVKHLNSANFEELTSKGLVLIDFWATWCGPCRMLGPVLDQVADEMGDEAVVGKINIDEEQDLAVKFGVRSIPALFVLKDGEVVESFVGVKDKSTLVNSLKSV
ncbi:MAG: thioredoxin [Victivallaceae bacterium]|nr:thioredoxin [Victivallaceae bacterium]